MSKNRLGKTPLFRDIEEDIVDKRSQEKPIPERSDVEQSKLLDAETSKRTDAQTPKQSNAKYKTQKKMTIYIPEELARQIKVLVAKTDKDISEYAAEGFEHILKKYE